MLHTCIMCVINAMHKVTFLFQLYNFGETVSIVFWTDTWRPDSFYDKICTNLERGMHTLCLLGTELSSDYAHVHSFNPLHTE